MAVLVDLDDVIDEHRPDDANGHHRKATDVNTQGHPRRMPSPTKQLTSLQWHPADFPTAVKPLPAPTPVEVSPANNTLERVLSIYPVAVEIASHIDLVTLDSLARTCRAAHGGLIQYRKVLATCTLRCNQDTLTMGPNGTFQFCGRAANRSLQTRQSLHNYNGKAGKCARDMVSECRRCSDVICRNCAIKQPVPKALKGRYRRLCTACAQAPIKDHVNPALDPGTPASSSFIQQGICQCETSGVWLCQPCGRSIRGQDQTYQRIWSWRNRYIDIGVTDVGRGIPCGREADCLDAVDKEVEVDSAGQQTSSIAPPPVSDPDENEPRSGYNVHEYENASGRVTNKTVMRIKVGRSVPEWHDEKATRTILGREVEGGARRWCGWCWRVVPGKDE